MHWPSGLPKWLAVRWDLVLRWRVVGNPPQTNSLLVLMYIVYWNVSWLQLVSVDAEGNELIEANLV
jgi:hypothetical protein